MSEEENSSQLSPWDNGDTIFDDPDAARQIGEAAARDMAGYVRDAIDGDKPPDPPPLGRPVVPRPTPPPNRRIRESDDRDRTGRSGRSRQGWIARMVARLPDTDSESSSSSSSEPDEPNNNAESSSLSEPDNTSSTTSAGSLSVIAMKCGNRRCCNHLIKVVPDGDGPPSSRERAPTTDTVACEICGHAMNVLTSETAVDDNRDQTVRLTAECRLCGVRMSKLVEIQTLRHIRLTAMCQCGRPMRLLSCEMRRRSGGVGTSGSSSSS
jgi:hypothetical protein